MKSSQKKQYTIRGLEPKLDECLRHKSEETGKSLNEVALEALRKGVGFSGESSIYHDLDFLAGTWRDDPEFEKILAEQDRVDPELWS